METGIVGRWAYYAPLWLGTLLVAALYVGNLGQLPPRPVWVHVVGVLVGAPLVGLELQLGLIGAQGVFAQVLPVPRGRSIRGGGAVLGGSLLLLWFALSLICMLLRSEGLGIAALVVGALALASLAAAAIVYAWHLPAAVRDFGPER
jgi:hypothetical protein